MNIITSLAYHSLLNRKITVTLTIISIALSVFLFLGVEKIRTSAKNSFTSTITNTDLILGARSGQIQLLLYSIFQIGNATNNFTWDSFQNISKHPDIEWIVPISLGDSLYQFRVMGTTREYFTRYKYRGNKSLTFKEGNKFNDLYDAVIGADVAKTLNYQVNDPIIVAHGLASVQRHEDHPFRISGILKKTGTPVDRLVLVSLEAIEAIHIDWETGIKIPGRNDNSSENQKLDKKDLIPKEITAALIGVTSRMKVFQLQREINEYSKEPLLAILPGVALGELWRIISYVETTLQIISSVVIITALLGMIAIIFASLNERRREMAILRSIGASPHTILGLLMVESVFMSIAGVVLGLIALYIVLIIIYPFLNNTFGIYIEVAPIYGRELTILLSIIIISSIVSIIPAIRAYKLSLNDGMMPNN